MTPDNIQRISVAWIFFAFAIVKLVMAINIPRYHISDARRHARRLLLLAVSLSFAFTGSMAIAATVELTQQQWTSPDPYSLATIIGMSILFPMLVASTVLYVRDCSTTASAYVTILLSTLLLIAAGAICIVDQYQSKRPDESKKKKKRTRPLPPPPT